MGNLAWTYKEWGAARPSFGSDEMYRHTLVLPNPFKVTSVDEKDGTKYRPALVLVIAPWWVCTHILKPSYRKDAREGREESRRMFAELEAEEGLEY